MAFARSLRPQLAALLPTPILWSRSRHAEDEGTIERGLVNLCEADISDGTQCDLLLMEYICFKILETEE
ncbi:hypothetical protein ILYODFUR_013825 [Ilyodon furcidens]|uniref:Uncharacterized protein n=1 Tax=Ilyodon furcidens TaxID=33524 RepID=A0ABV0T9K2_9TELE